MRKMRVIVTGKRACFTRPEMKAERVSYDVPTPGAMEGLLKSIYWKPAMRYVIDRIIVFHPIIFESVRRNEVKSKVSFSKMKKQMTETRKGEKSVTDPRIYTTEERTQRSSLILRDVKYGLEFHIEQTGLRNEREKQECDPQKKHEGEFIRRCKKGQSFRTPCLGCAEFPAEVQWTEEFDLKEISSENAGKKEFGYMLYRVNFRDHGRPKDDNWTQKIFSDEADSSFYKPIMENGIIDVQKYREEQRC